MSLIFTLSVCRFIPGVFSNHYCALRCLWTVCPCFSVGRGGGEGDVGAALNDGHVAPQTAKVHYG